jgi:hypothetical protein
MGYNDGHNSSSLFPVSLMPYAREMAGMGGKVPDATEADVIVTRQNGAEGTPRVLGIRNFRDMMAWGAWGVIGLTMRMGDC